jgi:hypothetical protein
VSLSGSGSANGEMVNDIENNENENIHSD